MRLHGIATFIAIAAATAVCTAGCAPLPSQHRYASANTQRNGCERVAATGSRLKNATRCRWGRLADAQQRRDALSQGRVSGRPREMTGRPIGF